MVGGAKTVVVASAGPGVFTPWRLIQVLVIGQPTSLPSLHLSRKEKKSSERTKEQVGTGWQLRSMSRCRM